MQSKTKRFVVLFFVVLLSFSLVILSFDLLKDVQDSFSSDNNTGITNSNSPQSSGLQSVSYMNWPGWEEFENEAQKSSLTKLPSFTMASFEFGIVEGIEFSCSMALREELLVRSVDSNTGEEIVTWNPKIQHGCILAPLDYFGSIIDSNGGECPEDWKAAFDADPNFHYQDLKAVDDIVFDEEDGYFSYSVFLINIQYKNVGRLFTVVPYTIDEAGVLTYGNVTNLRSGARSYAGVCSDFLALIGKYGRTHTPAEDTKINAAIKVLSDSIYLYAGLPEPGEELQYYRTGYDALSSITLKKGEEKEIKISVTAGFPDMYFAYKSSSSSVVEVNSGGLSVSVTSAGGNEIYNAVLLQGLEVGTSEITVYYCDYYLTFMVTVTE